MNQFTPQELQNLFVLTKRATVTGVDEAQTLVDLRNKIVKLLTEGKPKEEAPKETPPETK